MKQTEKDRLDILAHREELRRAMKGKIPSAVIKARADREAQKDYELLKQSPGWKKAMKQLRESW